MDESRKWRETETENEREKRENIELNSTRFQEFGTKKKHWNGSKQKGSNENENGKTN